LRRWQRRYSNLKLPCAKDSNLFTIKRFAFFINIDFTPNHVRKGARAGIPHDPVERLGYEKDNFLKGNDLFI